MCGICGLTAGGAGGPDPDALAAMSATLVHRGPDDEGHVIAGPVRRSPPGGCRSSTSPAATSRSPSEDGRVRWSRTARSTTTSELRGELEAAGHRFRTRCDTEVIVHLYEELGAASPSGSRHVRDRALGRAREAAGARARPLRDQAALLRETADGGLVFASELKALLALPEFDRALDMRALEALLAFNSLPGPLTIFEGVRKLPPGHLLSWEPGSGVDDRPYAQVTPAAAGELRDELGGRARRRAARAAARLGASAPRAGRPVGALLSGGIDSATLAALAAQESGERVRTFSIGFRERSFDELERARMAASATTPTTTS